MTDAERARLEALVSGATEACPWRFSHEGGDRIHGKCPGGVRGNIDMAVDRRQYCHEGRVPALGAEVRPACPELTKILKKFRSIARRSGGTWTPEVEAKARALHRDTWCCHGLGYVPNRSMRVLLRALAAKGAYIITSDCEGDSVTVRIGERVGRVVSLKGLRDYDAVLLAAVRALEVGH